MSGAIRGLVQTKIASGAVANRRIVAFGSTDNTAVQASAGNQKFLGVSDLPLGASAAAGEPFDVIRCDIAEVDYGGTITRGDRSTADSAGKAISAEGSASGTSIIGTAEVSGVSGDVGSVYINIQVM